MICFYHNDLDGRCAGAIVRQYYKNCETDKFGEKYIELDYKDEIPIAKIGSRETVNIVDFSFKPDVMEKVLERTKNIIWIDHHKTAFEYKYPIELIGLRKNEFSGCELAWMFYYDDIKMTRAVKLIGDRDKWAWKYGEETAKFNQGMKIYPHQPEDEIWDDLLESDERISEIINAGDICLKFRDGFCNDYANSYGFETKFEGHRCFAMGIYEFGSEAFGKRMEEYDMCLSYEFLGNNWIIGLYSTKIDVSEIAKKYGGGGHKGAAGFVSQLLPFCRIP